MMYHFMSCILVLIDAVADLGKAQRGPQTVVQVASAEPIAVAVVDVGAPGVYGPSLHSK